MNFNEYALIVAGGQGTRLKSAVPKQFIELKGMPVLMHTINAFYRYSEKIKIIVVLPENDFLFWNDLCRKYNFNKIHILQKGGATRFESVKKGLEKIEGNGVVAIHDGVRPLVSGGIIANAFHMAAEQRSAVAAVALKESIRSIRDGVSTTEDRSRFMLIQTPQAFDVSLIRGAYAQVNDATLTDDASVAEKAGHVIRLFEGSYENIKITTAEDLLFAEALLKQKADA